MKQLVLDGDTKIEASLGRLQIDNNDTVEPLWPVLMQPKNLDPKKPKEDL
jgi:hypothetical protein